MLKVVRTVLTYLTLSDAQRVGWPIGLGPIVLRHPLIHLATLLAGPDVLRAWCPGPMLLLRPLIVLVVAGALLLSRPVITLLTAGLLTILKFTKLVRLPVLPLYAHPMVLYTE